MKKSIREEIHREHVLRAIHAFLFDANIKQQGHRGESAKYDLILDGERYPPKSIVRIAGCFSPLGRLLRNKGDAGGGDFYGGEASVNDFLRKRGFQIVRK
ncbi:MAG: hypothetical protein IT449_14670 [Phycisphaerales bacterium]|nr:hypothetical protein [Phycisphaerales bacterium]